MAKLVAWKIYQQFINGKPVEDIAKENGCTVGRINAAIRRAKLQP